MKRGDVYLADLDPTKGSEQAGRRPVLVFQDDRLIRATLTVVAIPFTTNLRMQDLPTGVFIPAGEVACARIRLQSATRFAHSTS